MLQQAEFKRIVSPLKLQTRCLAAFPDQQGFLVMPCFLFGLNVGSVRCFFLIILAPMYILIAISVVN
ncbi:Os01g0635400 [Oryza sativa Japonica Group]|uniref:Os01g0635400 protein n=1 Tax=Oryza sativa subsp. japonica TaxID=39947 RepID=A0A0P0V5N2_ORYSJ|nr:hypothetical protein EE612_004553 [Oryza sativa]BAS73330.1 Os01g0635400 [Oryza sativa Japonica Group]